jgi:chemotaxis protein CheD
MLQPQATYDRRKGENEDISHNVITLFSGDCIVTRKPDDMLVTILGSCVSACIRDPVTGIGGMNHFLLPGDDTRGNAKISEATRYGAHAMEKLINGILSAGGSKDRLEIKVFGGGNVMNNSLKIGSRNAAFVHDFLKQEGLPIHSEDLEGDLPRRIHYFPHSGKAMMRKLQRKDDYKVVEQEEQYRRKISSTAIEGEIDLF